MCDSNTWCSEHILSGAGADTTYYTFELTEYARCRKKVKSAQDTWDKLNAAFTHSPALRLWGKLLVKCKRETKKGAMVPKLMQCVSSIQVKAPDLA